MNRTQPALGRRPATLLAVLLVVVPSGACREDAPSSAASTPSDRDPAGVPVAWSDAPLWDDGDSWSVAPEPKTVLGGFDDPSATLYRVTDLAVLPDGAVAVANGGAQEVLVFDAGGDVRERLGRAGDGPGEFRWLNGVFARGDSIVAVDGSRSRFSVFASDGTLAREFTATAEPGELSGIRAASLGEGGVAVFREFAFLDKEARGVVRLPADVFVLGWDGSTRNDLDGDFSGAAVFTGLKGMGPLPMGPDLAMAGADDRLAVGTGDSPEVRVFTADGSLGRIARWDARPRAVDESMQEDWKAAQREALAASLGEVAAEFLDEALDKQDTFNEDVPFPTTLPSLRALHLERSGHLWVQRYQMGMAERTPTSWQGKEVGPEVPADPRAPEWWVFDPEGRWLGTVTMPPGFRLHSVSEQSVWGVHRDEFGVETVREYALAR